MNFGIIMIYQIKNLKLLFAALTFTFFIPSIALAGVITDAPPIAVVLMRALNVLLSIAGILAMLSLVISGILYMTSGGDGTQAKTAKHAIGYSIVGLIVIVLSLVIVRQLAVLFQ